MILYSSTCRDFKDAVNNFCLTEYVTQSFEQTFHRKVNRKERASWEHSLSSMERIVSRSQAADDCGILIEYNLPNTSRRIDFIITGEDEESRKKLLIVELKQWDHAEATAMDGVVRTALGGGIRETSHPSYQAFGYKQFLNDFNEAVYSGSIETQSCAFLHNYTPENPEPLLLDQYADYFEDTPLFFRQDYDQLAAFIAEHVGKGRGMEILYAVEHSRIRPSRKLVDAVGALFRGNRYFTLIDEQKVLFEKLLHKADVYGGTSDQNAQTSDRRDSSGSRKQVAIIQGGPGTGKSVLSFNLLYGMLSKRKNAILSAPNAAFREVMKKKLQQAGFKKKTKPKQKKPAIKSSPSSPSNPSKHLSNNMILDTVITGSSAFLGLQQNMYDAVIVDEAHRLKDGSAFKYRGKNQIRDIIHASRYSIFFVDDHQAIRNEDIGNSANIRHIAEEFQAEVSDFKLDVQFRCSGMNGYINWVDHTLQIQDTANYDTWDPDAYVAELCNSPHEVYQRVRQKQAEGSSARMLAGYAWEWTRKKEGNPNGEVEDVHIGEFDFAMPWNSRSARSTWAIDDSGFNQIGCIHTSQGLEFDYVGVIIGKDLQYDPTGKKLYASWKHYKDLTGKKGLKNDPEQLNKLIKNIYKVLLTRAMKGCFIFCHDPKLQEYFRTCMPMREITEQNPLEVTAQKQPDIPVKTYPKAYPLKEEHNSLGEQPAAEEDHPFLKNRFLKNRQANDHSDQQE